jgi:hypothetical protein
LARQRLCRAEPTDRRNHGRGKPGRAALDGATPLSGNAYKLSLFETLVRRAILKAVA